MRVFRELVESLRIAIAAIRANSTRGVLTTLGIIIGIVGVVTTMTAANGISNNFKESVAVLGSDVLYVSRTPWVIQGNFFQFRNRPNVTLKDVDRLTAQLPQARAINPTVNTNRSLKYRSNVLENIDVIGTTDQHVQVSAAVPEVGRFMTAFDVRSRRRVCVLGQTLRESLFGNESPLHQSIKIGRHSFRVIGVMEKQGSAGVFGGPDFDSQVFIPISTFVKYYGGTHRDINVAVRAPDGASLEDFEYEVVGEMRKIHKLKPSDEDDFAINKMDSLVAMFNNVMGVVVLVGILITGVSLFVGGIGVMNIMFVSVTERTREIGIRKAIGARRRSILAQFLFEASAICLIGGGFGLAISYGIARLIDKFFLPTQVSPGIVMIAIGVSILTGIVAGIMPALRASKLNPIDALRYE